MLSASSPIRVEVYQYRVVKGDYTADCCEPYVAQILWTAKRNESSLKSTRKRHASPDDEVVIGPTHQLVGLINREVVENFNLEIDSEGVNLSGRDLNTRILRDSDSLS